MLAEIHKRDVSCAMYVVFDWFPYYMNCCHHSGSTKRNIQNNISGHDSVLYALANPVYVKFDVCYANYANTCTPCILKIDIADGDDDYMVGYLLTLVIHNDGVIFVNLVTID